MDKLLIGFIFIIASPNNQGNDDGQLILGLIILLFVLLLELKDKLYARGELEAGRSVQRALMPEESPVVPGWSIWLFSRQANDVGGDLIDFLHDHKSRFGIALGDVAGKGLGAALTMAKLQAVLRAPDLGLRFIGGTDEQDKPHLLPRPGLNHICLTDICGTET